MKKRTQNILFLTLNTFNTNGGIQKVCKVLGHTLNKVLDEREGGRLQMLSLYDRSVDERYLPITRYHGYAGNFLRFLIGALSFGRKSEVLIIGHINLLTVATLVKLVNKKIKVIVLAHGTEFWRHLPDWKRYLLRQNMNIWAVSLFTKKAIQNSHGITEAKITVVENCLDPFFAVPKSIEKPRALLERYNLTHNQPILLSLCRMSKSDMKKGYDKVLECIPMLLSDFPELKFLLCGHIDFNERQRLSEIIQQLQIEKHVVIVGPIPENELQAHFCLSDIFVMPSEKEGFGLVFIEAAACGCRIISGNADGSASAMLNGRLGSMINPGSKNELQAALRDGLKKPKNPTSALENQRLCLSHFNHESYQQKIEELI